MDSEFAMVSSRSTLQLFWPDANKIFSLRQSCYRKNKRFNNLDFITGPLLLDLGNKVNHWTLVFVDLNNKLFYFLDPLIASNETRLKIFDNWLHFIQSVMDTEKDKSLWKLGEFKHSKQNDSVSCGAIVLMMLETLLKRSHSLDFDDASIAAYRDQLNKRLMDATSMLFNFLFFYFYRLFNIFSI